MVERDRVALVTGTSSGIGAAIADRLVRTRWVVIGLARRPAALESPHYEHFEVDLSDLPALGAIAEERLEPLLSDTRWQRVGLVNNAAAPGALSALENADPLRLAAVNAVAPIFLMGFMTRVVLSPTWLRIANISSGAAVQAVPGLGDYGSSKAALRLAGMVLRTGFDSGDAAGGRRRNAAVLSYDPASWTRECRNWRGRGLARSFLRTRCSQDFAAQGLLQAPEAVIGKVIEFLVGNSRESFLEVRGHSL